MIERDFDLPFIADLALREKQIQQNYRPVIAVHKWFARRPGTLFRGLILAEFSSRPLRDVFYHANDLPLAREYNRYHLLHWSQEPQTKKCPGWLLW